MRDTRRTRAVLAVLLVVATGLVLLGLRGGDTGPGAALRSGASAVLGPLQSAAGAVLRPIGGFFTSVGSLGTKDERIAELEAENRRLRTQASTGVATRAQAEQLARLLKVGAAGRYRTVPALVVAAGAAQGFAWTVALDVGRRDGIKVDMTVVDGDGLVGRVARVGPTTCTVVLLVDSTSTVGVRIAGSQQIALLNGTGRQDQLEMQLLNPLAPVEAGDRIVTGPRGTLYAAGVPVGEVTEVRGTPGQYTRVALIRPFAVVSTLDVVGVVVENPRTDPRDAVLGATATASPTASPTAGPAASPSGSPAAGPSAGPSASR